MRSLEFLTHDLLFDLKQDDVILERSKIQEIFAYLPEIQVLHQNFQNWMELTAKSWAEKEMAGWIFGAVLEQPALVKAYSMFVINYEHAISGLGVQAAVVLQRTVGSAGNEVCPSQIGLVDGLVDQLLAMHEPVFVDKLSPGTFHDHSKLTCGTYYAPNLAAPLYVRQPLQDWIRNRRMLWICTFGGAKTTVTFYTHEVLSNTLVRRTHLLLNDVFVECIVHVPKGQAVLGDDSTVDTVWMGSRNLLMIYSGSYPLVDKQLASVSIKGCPKQMVHRADRVYIGLNSGNVLIYKIGATAWNLQAAVLINVCAHPIATLKSIKGNMYVAAGTSVSVIDGKTDRLCGNIQSEDLQGNADAQALTTPIICMAYSVNGMWLVRHKSSIVSLYRLSPWKHLKDIDVTRPVRRFSTVICQAMCEGNIFATSIALVNNSLWIGTSIGVTMMMALPMRRNVPLI
uniref:Uncharacterized protein n=1 Tax=Anopheles atroparvus TaxID=41427 RepID=A0A182IYA4_ANOAO